MTLIDLVHRSTLNATLADTTYTALEHARDHNQAVGFVFDGMLIVVQPVELARKQGVQQPGKIAGGPLKYVDHKPEGVIL